MKKSNGHDPTAIQARKHIARTLYDAAIRYDDALLVELVRDAAFDISFYSLLDQHHEDRGVISLLQNLDGPEEDNEGDDEFSGAFTIESCVLPVSKDRRTRSQRIGAWQDVLARLSHLEQTDPDPTPPPSATIEASVELRVSYANDSGHPLRAVRRPVEKISVSLPMESLEMADHPDADYVDLEAVFSRDGVGGTVRVAVAPELAADEQTITLRSVIGAGYGIQRHVDLKRRFHDAIEAVFAQFEESARRAMERTTRVRAETLAETVCAYLLRKEGLSLEAVAQQMWPEPFADLAAIEATDAGWATESPERPAAEREVAAAKSRAKERVKRCKRLLEGAWRELLGPA